MRNLVSTYVDQFRQDRQKQLKLAAVLAALAVLVAGLVFWQLHSTGVAMTNEVFCGQEEHIHDDGCYKQVLICGNGDEDHVHDESCYETVLTCQIPEHTHTVECLMDETADVETADVWETTLPELTDVWSDDVVAIAESQVGYTESTSNFILAEDGETHMGYTRYGAWYGNAYADWDAMFASFCLNYANVPSSAVAENSGAYALAVSLNEQGLYIDSADFTPAAGDLVFFSENENGNIDRVGVIANVSDNELTVIEGNSEDAVAENTYDTNDADIVAFGILPDQGTPEGIETADGNILYAANDGGVYVSVTAPAGAIPEGALLSATLLDENSEDYASAADAVGLNVQTLSADNGGTGMAVLDICFLLDGLEVEPAEPVTVSIDAGAILPDGAENIVIRHLEETEEGVVPVLMAELDASSPVAEFEVESFSSFTITWAGNAAGGNATSVTVYVYDINGLGIYDSDEQDTYTWTSGAHTIDSLVSEHVSGKIGDSYTFAYATVQYLTASAMGGSVTTIGNKDDPVVSVSWNGTNYTVTLSSGATTTVSSSDADEFYINLYFSTPMVSISVTDADTDNHTVALTADAEYFQNDNITYTWEIIDGEDYASIEGTGENATVTWSEGDQAGNTVTVRVTATTTDASGEVVETAIDTYELIYGMQQVTYTVYYGTTGTSGTIASGAHVAIYDNEGNLVSNGETDNIGQVTLWVVPGTEYTLEASYTVSSGTGIQMTYTHYSYEDENYSYTEGDNTDIYLTESLSGFYEHVDVKLSIADPDDEGYSDVLANVDYVKIYDEAGELVYQSAQLVHNEGTNDYNVLFADADGNVGDNPHSIAFYDSYTIEIGYEISYTYEDSEGNTQEYTESYVATINKNSTYVKDEYYSYSGTNAYQLFNEIYGTTIDEDDWANALANGTLEELLGDNYNEHGIDLEGLNYFYVAANLCDTRDMTGQAGLDLALGINSLRRYSSTTWNFNVQKTYNRDADAGEFAFNLYQAHLVNEGDDQYWFTDVSTTGDFVLSLSNDEMTLADGETRSVDTMSDLFSFDFDSSMVGQTQTYYFILVEVPGSEENVAYDNTIYGIKVEVTLNSATDMTNVTIEETAYSLTNASQSSVEGNESYWYFTLGGELELDADNDGYTIFPFDNYYDEGSYPVDIFKYTTDENEGKIGLEGAEFILTKQDTVETGGEGTITFASSARGTTTGEYVVDHWSNEYSHPAYQVFGVSDDGSLTFTGLPAGYTYFVSNEEDAESGISVSLTEESDGTYTGTVTGLEADSYYLYRVEEESAGGDTGGEETATWYAMFIYAYDEDKEEYVYIFDGWTLNEDEATHLISGEDGYIHIASIEAGNYTLIEVEAPDGYFITNDSIDIVVKEDEEDGENTVVTVDVENIPGSELPNTGGIGTWIYTVTGLLLIGGASSLIVYRKRRAVES